MRMREGQGRTAEAVAGAPCRAGTLRAVVARPARLADALGVHAVARARAFVGAGGDGAVGASPRRLADARAILRVTRTASFTVSFTSFSSSEGSARAGARGSARCSSARTHLAVAVVRAVLGAGDHLARVTREALGTVARAIEAEALVRARARARAHGAVLAGPAGRAFAHLARVALTVARAHEPFVAFDDDARTHLLGAVHATVTRGAHAHAVHARAVV